MEWQLATLHIICSATVISSTFDRSITDSTKQVFRCKDEKHKSKKLIISDLPSVLWHPWCIQSYLSHSSPTEDSMKKKSCFHKQSGMGWVFIKSYNDFLSWQWCITWIKRFKFSSFIFPGTSNVTVTIACKRKDTLIITTLNKHPVTIISKSVYNLAS